MRRQIPETTRLKVAERAGSQFEYCRVSDEYTLFAFHIDHIISLKHGGNDHLDNLAYACQICNLNKGTDIATILQDTGILVRLYHPRNDHWAEHFKLDPFGEILPLTDIGEATVKLLDLNHPESIIERREQIRLKRIE
jgi:hypothetical protein